MVHKPASRFVFGDEGEEEEEGEGEDTDAPAPEEVDNDLEIAYENLSVAARAYEQMDTESSKRRLGDVHLLLGHIHMEAGESQRIS